MKTQKIEKNKTTIKPFAPRFQKKRAGEGDSERFSYTEYGAGVVFEDDASDAAEYLATIRRTGALEPERHLLLAILEDAIVSFQKNLHARTAKKRELFEEAEAWILDERDSGLCSFESICNVLGIEPSYLRRGLVAWKREHSKPRAATSAKAA